MYHVKMKKILYNAAQIEPIRYNIGYIILAKNVFEISCTLKTLSFGIKCWGQIWAEESYGGFLYKLRCVEKSEFWFCH